MLGKRAKILSDTNIRDLLAFAARTRHPLRNRVIVLLSVKAGLRAGEIANLTCVMTQKSVANPSVARTGKVVVFGLDNNWRPHAAWFPHLQAALARTAAKQLRLNVIEIPDGTSADLIAKLPAGRIHAAGPPNREDLYEKVVTTFNRRGEAGNEPDAAILTDLPETWAAIKPGHLVLAQDSLIDGWYEAIVVGRTGDKLTLRSRDYPGYLNAHREEDKKQLGNALIAWAMLTAMEIETELGLTSPEQEHTPRRSDLLVKAIAELQS